MHVAFFKEMIYKKHQKNNSVTKTALSFEVIILIMHTGDSKKKVPTATGDFMKKVLLATWALRDR